LFSFSPEGGFLFRLHSGRAMERAASYHRATNLY
jgi:hypothetical protein